ncbi:hypothetical protein NC651_024644 [Populus alba x Populus x berolinensis]|nr:hypothetical protein NC651_024644 [Populus alba x Populus x berolinensis]
MRAACELAAHVLENADSRGMGSIFYASDSVNIFYDARLEFFSQSVCLTGVASCQLTCFLGVMNEHALMGIYRK